MAKVETSTPQKQSVSNLAHELNVGLHLADLGAPIVPPSAEILPAVYRCKNLEVTFQQHCAGELRDDIDRPKLVAAIKQFHAAFADYHGELRSFTEKYEECYLLLYSVHLSGGTAGGDRLIRVQT